MKALEEGRIEPTDEVVRHIDLCLGCRACETACPSGVEYGLLVEGARSYLETRTKRRAFDRWKRRILSRVLPDPAWLAVSRSFVDVAARLGMARLAGHRWLPLPLRRLAALLPDPSQDPLIPPVFEAQGVERGTVALLAGCVARVYFARVNHLTARLLAAAGYRVLVPRDQVCCGALLSHLGEKGEAERRARKNTNVLLRTEADWIVTNAAGCGAWLREYGRVLARDELYANGARTLSERVRDVTQLLVEGSLPPAKHEVRARVAYHDACHLAHGQGVRREPRDLLRSVPGLEVVEIVDSELCCGSAGTYNLTEPEMAWRLGERKARAILDTGAEMVAAGNPGCILQIRAALRLAGREIPVLHPVEIVARAQGVV
jgi:glycolate oxidase iron-sulfur subunit